MFLRVLRPRRRARRGVVAGRVPLPSASPGLPRRLMNPAGQTLGPDAAGDAGSVATPVKTAFSMVTGLLVFFCLSLVEGVPETLRHCRRV